MTGIRKREFQSLVASDIGGSGSGRWSRRTKYHAAM